MWNLTEKYESDRKNMLLEIKDRLKKLEDVIPVVRNLDVAINVNHGDKDKRDIALILDIDSMEDLKIYAEHPEHVKEVAYLADKITDRIALDYELD